MEKANQRILVDLFARQELTVDMLPHTDEEVRLAESYNAMVPDSQRLSVREIYIALMNLRKRGGLPKKRRKR